MRLIAQNIATIQGQVNTALGEVVKAHEASCKRLHKGIDPNEHALLADSQAAIVQMTGKMMCNYVVH